MTKIFVIGAAGQLGIELVLALQAQYGVSNVDVSDIRVPDDEGVMRSRFLHLDAIFFTKNRNSAFQQF